MVVRVEESSRVGEDSGFWTVGKGLGFGELGQGAGGGISARGLRGEGRKGGSGEW